MDPWDEVLDVEAKFYSEGFQEGQKAAVEEGIIEHGRRAGFMKGYAIGLEVGFMESTIERLLDQQSNTDSGENVSSTSAATINTGTGQRTQKRRVEVVTRCKNLPCTNAKDVDFVQEVQQLRTLFKQCGSTVGDFLPKKEQSETQQW